MNFRLVFEKYLFWLFLISFLLMTVLGESETDSINKTIGWMYDSSNSPYLLGWINWGSAILFLLGYGMVLLASKKTHFKLSVIHFLLFLTLHGLGKFGEPGFQVIWSLTFVSIMMFVLNLNQSRKIT
ncbi:hypothetical protein [Sediminicola luteus]|uniref:Uncharacterized protein n=1 Tax=Sediminicola luteus TaxID=319238 RepID=A0A2A4GDW5_9FLAO|nr:hypothetical protein [Sediminicola luteus]PCE66643.1 hypothetical protein B7P33_04940 [Sediminicola luteus]